jgi:DNA-directed RNA polymerase specialized sigma24 family protein
MSMHHPLEVECLAAQGAWVRRLALDLARDEHEAEDIAQETWLAALRRPHAGKQGLAAWCSGVVRNLVQFRARTEANRVARERAVARP